MLLNFNELKQNIYFHCAIKEFSSVDTSLNKEIRIKYCMEFFNHHNTLDYNNLLPNFLCNNIYYSEYILEEFRQKNFPSYPSRLSCLFSFATYEIAAHLNKFYNWNSPIKEVHVDKNCKIIKCDMNWITYFRKGNKMTPDLCRAYWQGIPLNNVFPDLNAETVYEYLIEGQLSLV